MKLLLTSLSLALVAGSLCVTSCNNDGSSSSTTDSTTVVAPEAPVDTLVVTKDTLSSEKGFINFVAPANAKEMAWLVAGINHGSKEIKDHAKMMLADHKKMGKEAGDYAASRNIAVPETDTTGVVDINDKTGKDWDKAWADKMVDDHQALLDKLHSSQDEVNDPDLKAWIAKNIPVVESHLAMAKKLQDKMK